MKESLNLSALKQEIFKEIIIINPKKINLFRIFVISFLTKENFSLQRTFKVVFTSYLKHIKYTFCALIFHPLSETEPYENKGKLILQLSFIVDYTTLYRFTEVINLAAQNVFPNTFKQGKHIIGITPNKFIVCFQSSKMVTSVEKFFRYLDQITEHTKPNTKFNSFTQHKISLKSFKYHRRRSCTGHLDPSS